MGIYGAQAESKVPHRASGVYSSSMPSSSPARSWPSTPGVQARSSKHGLARRRREGGGKQSRQACRSSRPARTDSGQQQWPRSKRSQVGVWRVEAVRGRRTLRRRGLLSCSAPTACQPVRLPCTRSVEIDLLTLLRFAGTLPHPSVRTPSRQRTLSCRSSLPTRRSCATPSPSAALSICTEGQGDPRSAQMRACLQSSSHSAPTCSQTAGRGRTRLAVSPLPHGSLPNFAPYRRTPISRPWGAPSVWGRKHYSCHSRYT